MGKTTISQETIRRIQPVTHALNDSRSNILKELVARAGSRGYITYEDLVEVMADDIDEESVEALLKQLCSAA